VQDCIGKIIRHSDADHVKLDRISPSRHLQHLKLGIAIAYWQVHLEIPYLMRTPRGYKNRFSKSLYKRPWFDSSKIISKFQNF